MSAVFFLSAKRYSAISLLADQIASPLPFCYYARSRIAISGTQQRAAYLCILDMKFSLSSSPCILWDLSPYSG
jgi:hypothetical protein